MESIFQLMRDYLKKSGIKAHDVGNGRLIFSVNNLNYIFECNENDQHFFRLSLPQINRQGVQIANIEQRIQQLNRNYKVAKIVRDNDGSLWIIADTFVYSTDNVEPLFFRLTQAMTDMINEYRTIENQGNGTV